MIVHVLHFPPSSPSSTPQARLQWKRCADIPGQLGRFSAQAVVMGEKVYVGGGITEKLVDKFHIFKYNTTRDEWSHLPTTLCVTLP